MPDFRDDPVRLLDAWRTGRPASDQLARCKARPIAGRSQSQPQRPTMRPPAEPARIGRTIFIPAAIALVRSDSDAMHRSRNRKTHPTHWHALIGLGFFGVRSECASASAAEGPAIAEDLASAIRVRRGLQL